MAAIEKLMQRKGAFDHILLETTGLADPGQLGTLKFLHGVSQWPQRSDCVYVLAERRVCDWIRT